MEEKNTSRGLVIGIVVAALAIAGLVVFVLSGQPANAPENTNTQTNAPTGSSERDNEAVPSPGERMMITFTNNGFEPDNLTVKKGTVVTIKNDSSRNLQFSSNDHPTHRANPEMNLPTTKPGESDSYTATVVGKWGFHDHLDDSKTGTITVTE